MKHKSRVYGIGNPLIDIIAQVADEDLSNLGIHKGTMHLIDERRRRELLAFLAGKSVSYVRRLVSQHHHHVLRWAEATAGGDDEFGTIYKTAWGTGSARRVGVLQEPTGSSIILISPDSERTMNTYLGANRYYQKRMWSSNRSATPTLPFTDMWTPNRSGMR